MRTIFYMIWLAGITLSLASCDDFDNLLPKEYAKRLYLSSTGLQPITLYKTGENTDYQFAMIKSGNDPEAVAQARIELMDEADLLIFGESKQINYKMLPKECYSLKDTEATLSEVKQYSNVTVTFETDRIDKILKNKREDEVYVLGLKLESEDIVNEDGKLLLLNPEVISPKVSFGLINKIQLFCGIDGASCKIPLVLPVSNKWDFSCQIEVNDLELSHGYVLGNGGIANFVAGTDTAWIEVFIDPIESINTTVTLPLRITSVEGMPFEWSETPLLIEASMQLDLDVTMLSSNAQEPTEGSLSGLLDNNIGTFFHSAWSVTINENHYLQVNLPRELTHFIFSYNNRSNGSTLIGNFNVMVSYDGSNYEKIRNYDQAADNLPTEGGAQFVSEELITDKPIKSIRFVDTNGFFVWSEFSLKGY